MLGGGVLGGDWVDGGEGRLGRWVAGGRWAGRSGARTRDVAEVVGGVRGGVRCGWWVRRGVEVCGHEGGCGERWVRMILRSEFLPLVIRIILAQGM